ncbi:undecaprenyldiphospho-muramoylpentapeptide beta-N-acetylglucosaminyltransferase [Gordonia jinhuaensis]
MVVAGGGTAGHIEPALAVADAIRLAAPDARITALGTRRGLETTLVPDRGYDLELIPPVPLPRKLTPDLFKVPMRLVSSIRRTRQVLDKVDADVVIGFGGYVSLPAYAAAKLRLRGRVPVVIHEANASAGIANKVGARMADRVLAAVDGSGLDATKVGMPVRASLAHLDRAALRAQARNYFGLDPEAPTVLVFGGSQGAQRLNSALEGASKALGDAGIGVLHAHGAKNSVSPDTPADAPPYVAVAYLNRMDLAYAAADLVICRSGAMTVAEVSSAGLPAVYVPLPHGNGEQRLNAAPIVDAGGGLLVDDADLTADWITANVPPLLTDAERLSVMGEVARSFGHRDAADAVAAVGLELGRRHHRDTARHKRFRKAHR